MIGDQQKASDYWLNLQMIDFEEAIYYNIVKFDLKYGKYIRAEQTLNTIDAYFGENVHINRKLLKGCLMMQREQYRLAKDCFNQVLNIDWKN